MTVFLIKASLRMKVKIRIGILRWKITGCLRRMLRFFPLRKIRGGFRTENICRPVSGEIPFFLPTCCLAKKPTPGNSFPCCLLKHNTFLHLLGKNNLDTSGCSRFSQFRRSQPKQEKQDFSCLEIERQAENLYLYKLSASR